jgi:two-component system phosphate regulon response regulator PhoB
VFDEAVSRDTIQGMSAPKTILVIEDEADLCDLISYNLDREGYRSRRARDGAAAQAEIKQHPPDLIILDRMLPDRSGDEIIADVRRDSRTSSTPVIMLTAKAEESDELVGFALGADDYVAKPFSMKALMARVAALLRRAPGAVAATPAESLSAGPVKLDTVRHEVTVDGVLVSLTATEFRLLRALMTGGGRLLSRDQLIDAAMGPDVAVVDRTIDVHIAALRKKLGSASCWIQTIRGAGYTFRAPANYNE